MSWCYLSGWVTECASVSICPLALIKYISDITRSRKLGNYIYFKYLSTTKYQYDSEPQLCETKDSEIKYKIRLYWQQTIRQFYTRNFVTLWFVKHKIWDCWIPKYLCVPQQQSIRFVSTIHRTCASDKHSIFTNTPYPPAQCIMTEAYTQDVYLTSQWKLLTVYGQVTGSYFNRWDSFPASELKACNLHILNSKCLVYYWS
jgi:hypothetical protein